jgi:uncharacterized OB-fold protein
MTTPGLDDASGSALEGVECPACSVVTYPPVVSCPRCGTGTVARELSTHGVVWSWTVQRFTPKSPPFEQADDEAGPFIVGYIELPENVRILAVLEFYPDEVEIGMKVELIGGSGVPRGRSLERR